MRIGLSLLRSVVFLGKASCSDGKETRSKCIGMGAAVLVSITYLGSNFIVDCR